MQLRILLFPVFIHITSVFAQITTFPYSEAFDASIAPNLPDGWSAAGFSISASTAQSPPNCVSVTGNSTVKQLTSPGINFTNKNPDKLLFYERRSNTAAGYRLEIRASIDNQNFNILLARFDTIPTTSNYILRIVSLRETGLAQQSNVRFRWHLLGDNTGTTGVLRIDDITMTASAGYDVGFSRIDMTPVQATRNDSIIVSAVIKNYGTLHASNFSVRFFGDDNTNGLCESGEQFAVVPVLSLHSGDSLTCRGNHAPMKAGVHGIIATIDYPLDDNRVNDTVQSTITIGNKKDDLLINEIMYDPAGDEPEWVEVTNMSPDTINLINWRISDSNISTKSIITQTNVFFPPRSYFVIAKDIGFASSHSSVPVVCTNFSALNNSTPDAVILYDAKMNTIDSVMYAPSWGGQHGKSLERIDVEMPGTVPANWGTSQDPLGSTPGRKNSIVRLEYDVMIGPLSQIQIRDGEKYLPGVHVCIHNIGRRTADSVLVSFYVDVNRNGLPEASECVQTIISPQSLAPGDSMCLSEPCPPLPAGANTLIVAAEWRCDENGGNNRASLFMKISCEPHALAINEIMYDPFAGQNEWIELYNRSEHVVDLSQWTISDRPTLNNVNSFDIPDEQFIMKPGEYAVAAADSSFFKLFQNLLQSDPTIHICILNRSGGFSLNNDGDAVVLKDLTGQTIDSVAYLSGWHHPDVVDTKGRSLERINPNIESNDPRNWSTCTNLLGGTPGKVNSIRTTGSAGNLPISISPNPFSPDGDGFEDFCIIRYTLPVMTSTVNIRIYDVKGRLVRTLANGELAGSQDEIVWNGYDDNKQRARIGVYIIFLEATDKLSGKVLTAKAVAVVAAKL